MRTTLDNELYNLMNSLKIECYHVDGNVKMKDLGIEIDDPNVPIEFDDIAVVGDVGIIFETTTEKEGNKKKIDTFYYNKFRVFVETHNKNKLIFNAFPSLTKTNKEKLKAVKTWKCVYIGTSDELLNKQLTQRKYPESSELFVINSEHFAYLNFLSDRLGKFGRGELLKLLDIENKDPEAPQRPIIVESLKLENKKISGTIDADVFVFQAPAVDLLKLSLVPRYGSLTSSMPEFGDDDYQRLLNKKKLESIAKIINKGKGNSSFPNAITVVLADDVNIAKNVSPTIKQISIPNYHGSIEVIDGQHRLYGYAHSKLSKKQLEQSKILVIGLKFNGNTTTKRKEAAKIFFQINREQTKVHNDLLYLLSNPVLGEIEPKPLAAKVLSNVNTVENGPLQNVFSTRPFLKKNKAGAKPVKIVMVANELSKFFNKDNKDKTETEKLYNSITTEAWGSYERKRPKKIIDEVEAILTEFFTIVKSVFNDDWDHDKSLLYSSKYLMAFVRLLIEYKKKGYVKSTIGKKLSQLKTSLTDEIKKKNNVLLKKNKIIFSVDYSSIPTKKEDQTKIANFILKHGL